MNSGDWTAGLIDVALVQNPDPIDGQLEESRDCPPSVAWSETSPHRNGRKLRTYKTADP
jgi:hypothetical protein